MTKYEIQEIKTNLEGRSYPRCCSIGDGKAIIFGGGRGKGKIRLYYNELHLFDGMYTLCKYIINTY